MYIFTVPTYSMCSFVQYVKFKGLSGSSKGTKCPYVYTFSLKWVQTSVCSPTPPHPSPFGVSGAIHQQLQQSFERMKRVLIGGAKGRGTFSISDASRLFVAKRRKTPAANSEVSLLSHDKAESTHEPSRLEPLQSTPRSWREQDSVTRERPLSSTPLADKTAPPSTPDSRPSPFSHSVYVESDSSVADSCLVGRGSAARVADKALHGGVQKAVQDLMVSDLSRPTRHH